MWRFDRMATVCHPATGPGHRLVRRGRQALRGAGRDLPAPARATARAWWRRPTTPPRNAGGAPCPTTSRVEQAQARWTGSPAVRGDTRLRRTADGTEGHRRHRRRRASRCAGPAGAVPGRHGRDPDRVARRRWSPSAATATRCHPSWPARPSTVTRPARRRDPRHRHQPRGS